MGKLAGLLSSGIGLAMEAAGYQSPSSSSSSSDKQVRKGGSSRNGHSAVGYATSTYGAREEFSSSRDIFEEPKHSLDSDTALHDIKRYADFQESLADKSQHRSTHMSSSISADSFTSPNQDGWVSHTSEIWEPVSTGRSLIERPVIIPQRRPENKSRGWVRAYPPALMEYGIDENNFLKFLDSYNERCKASPYLDVVNVAALGVGFAPGIAPMVISMAVPVAVHMAKTSQTNNQSTSFLANANVKLFAPHGLYAMIMTYKPDQMSQTCMVDTSASSSSPMRNFESDTTKRNAQEFQLPPSADLIFPTPESQLTDYENNKFLKMSHFMADYADRRAQARYAHNNPESSLVMGPQPQFKSRWGDPNHPANSGGLISLISGREKGTSPRDDERDDRKIGDRRRRRNSKGSRQRSGLLSTALDTAMAGKSGTRGAERPRLMEGARRAVAGPGNEDQSLLKRLKAKTMQSDILYLMIVDNTSQNKTSASRTPSPRTVSTNTVFPKSSFTPARSHGSTQSEWVSEFDHDPRPRVYELDDEYALPPPYSARPRVQSHYYDTGDDVCVPTL